jgi:endo-1,4-beta-mannosidase
LEDLRTSGVPCGANTLTSKLYAAHINYAVSLENSGNQAGAIREYQIALVANGRGKEALNALVRLNAQPAPPSCAPAQLNEYLPPTTTSPDDFVSSNGFELSVNRQMLVARGVNYYPRHAPWERFITDSNLDEVAQELDVIASAGFNTLRIFLWHDPLFTCAPETATPNTAAFVKLDAFIALARARGFRLIITLNDLPDLLFHPLYTDWAHYDAQTTFIVKRYRDDPTILAWDLRNEGDLDYGASPGIQGGFSRDTVLAWLSHIAGVVRANDNHHLLTAGWWGDASETANFVDILSFHYWKDAHELVERINGLQSNSHLPIVLEEVGYSSLGNNGEEVQAASLGSTLSVAEQENLAGWLIWTAFDFLPPAGQLPNVEHLFGLWRNDLTPKPALYALPPLKSP